MQAQTPQETNGDVDNTVDTLVASLKHLGYDEQEVSAAVPKFANLAIEEAVPAAVQFLSRQDSGSKALLPRVIICSSLLFSHTMVGLTK